jgi:hypothetical protein
MMPKFGNGNGNAEKTKDQLEEKNASQYYIFFKNYLQKYFDCQFELF